MIFSSYETNTKRSNNTNMEDAVSRLKAFVDDEARSCSMELHNAALCLSDVGRKRCNRGDNAMNHGNTETGMHFVGIYGNTDSRKQRFKGLRITAAVRKGTMAVCGLYRQ